MKKKMTALFPAAGLWTSLPVKAQEDAEGVKTDMKEYTYKVVREYPDGSRGKRAKKLTLFKPLNAGGLYVHLGKGFPGMQRVLSEEVRQTED